MKFYNTLTKKIEEFIPNQKGNIKLYTCGPTVYHYAHLGNMRTYIMEDILEKALNYLGYKVDRVMNITDVGHLQSDGDAGEDKMTIAAKRENKTSQQIAEYYTQAFSEDCALVNVKKPNVVSKATENISEYIEMIKALLEKDYAYIANGNVYFDTSKVDNYYELSGRNQDELLIAVREGIQEDISKRNPFDFGLWFTNSKFLNQELQWDSPWGRGYPGWHIECSAIAIKYLGEYLDIHCGAEDAVFPHHSNEIAQSEGYLGHKWCNYWLHLSFLNIDNSKMSKSSGNILRVLDLANKGYDPLSFRYFILNTHYHRQVNFSFDSLDIAESAYKKLKNKISSLNDCCNVNEGIYNEYDYRFKQTLENDLNTANALTLLFELLKEQSVNDKTKIELIKSWDEVFSLELLTKKENIHEEHDYIMKKIEERNQAKKEKNYELADQIRINLEELNIELLDTRDGTTYKIKNQ